MTKLQQESCVFQLHIFFKSSYSPCNSEGLKSSFVQAAFSQPPCCPWHSPCQQCHQSSKRKLEPDLVRRKEEAACGNSWKFCGNQKSLTEGWPFAQGIDRPWITAVTWACDLTCTSTNTDSKRDALTDASSSFGRTQHTQAPGAEVHEEQNAKDRELNKVKSYLCFFRALIVLALSLPYN